MSPEKKFMTLEDVAELLGVNYQLIYRLVRSGELPAIRLGRVYRITKEDLDAYLIRQKRVAGRVLCEACGTLYESKAAVKYACKECGAPICFDCWQRTKTHICMTCATGSKKTKKRKK